MSKMIDFRGLRRLVVLRDLVLRKQAEFRSRTKCKLVGLWV